MNYEINEGYGIRGKVYVFDGYLYLKKLPKCQKTMQTRPKKGIRYKIHKKAQNISESHRNTTEKREKEMKLAKNKSFKI